MSKTLIDLIVETEVDEVGFSSWTTGFVCHRSILFDELKKHPEAVFNRLCNKDRWELAEMVFDHYL